MPRTAIAPTSLALALLLALAAATAGAGAAEAQQLAFTPDHASGTYAVGERIGWTVTALPGQSAAPGRYHYTVRRDGKTVVARGTFTLTSGRRRSRGGRSTRSCG